MLLRLFPVKCWDQINFMTIGEYGREIWYKKVFIWKNPEMRTSFIFFLPLYSLSIKFISLIPLCTWCMELDLNVSKYVIKRGNFFKFFLTNLFFKISKFY
jgi:hypothetical protein